MDKEKIIQNIQDLCYVARELNPEDTVCPACNSPLHPFVRFLLSFANEKPPDSATLFRCQHCGTPLIIKPNQGEVEE